MLRERLTAMTLRAERLGLAAFGKLFGTGSRPDAPGASEGADADNIRALIGAVFLVTGLWMHWMIGAFVYDSLPAELTVMRVVKDQATSTTSYCPVFATRSAEGTWVERRSPFCMSDNGAKPGDTVPGRFSASGNEVASDAMISSGRGVAT